MISSEAFDAASKLRMLISSVEARRISADSGGGGAQLH